MTKQETIADLLGKTDLLGNLQEEVNYTKEHLIQLKAACENFLRRESFHVSQIVKWKEKLKNRKFPLENQPAIVVSILDEPIVSKDDESGSPYFLETLDIILGIIVDDGTFLTFHYDSRRFESYEKTRRMAKLDN
jgi:hypothetical protein